LRLAAVREWSFSTTSSLFPDDEDAKRLHRQTFTLGEFLQKETGEYRPPALRAKAVVHGHCHHKAIMGFADEEGVLRALGLDFEVLDSGCCGMAGSFGFEEGDRYQVSIQCGERVLLPAVRSAATDTLIIADGFSCREQIAQTTDRYALHLAQVLQMALRQDARQPVVRYPEARLIEQARREHQQAQLRTAAVVGAGALLAVGAWVWARGRQKVV
jgi:hypothetical protein